MRALRLVIMGVMTTPFSRSSPGVLDLFVFGASQDFWIRRARRTGAPDEVKEMLCRRLGPSLLRFRFSITVRAAIMAWPAERAGAGLSGQRVGGGNIGERQAPDTATNPGTFHAVVRWETARPVQVAEKSRPGDGDSRFYIISLNGDLPDFARPNDEESSDAREQRVEMLRESTRLDRKGGSPIYLERLESSATGTLFYFSRAGSDYSGQKEVTFSTNMGPLEIKVKFPLKDMMYKGKLDL